MHILHKQRCRVCGSVHLAPVIDLGDSMRDFMKRAEVPEHVRIVAARNGMERRSAIMSRPGSRGGN